MPVAHFFHGMYQVSVQQQCKEAEYSLVPRLLPSFLSHTVCDKKLGRSLGTRLAEYTLGHDGTRFCKVGLQEVRNIIISGLYG